MTGPTPPLPQRDDYYLALAFTAASRANCRGRKVGAILVKGDRVIATGYNGTPEGVTNCLDGGCLRCADREIELLPKEFAIVEFLMQNAGVLVSRKMIFESVWGYSFNHQSSVIDVHIGKIRKKLDPDGLNPRIHTVRNTGFILRAPS